MEYDISKNQLKIKIIGSIRLSLPHSCLTWSWVTALTSGRIIRPLVCCSIWYSLKSHLPLVNCLNSISIFLFLTLSSPDLVSISSSSQTALFCHPGLFSSFFLFFFTKQQNSSVGHLSSHSSYRSSTLTAFF